ncbi:MAG TPA: M20/M25/M40 family metallo-hydrolase [Ktedonobacterales bacterium]|nr:M20/M25/M40 family metallo-hydrolase [Ktedonobacterales bacterium]
MSATKRTTTDVSLDHVTTTMRELLGVPSVSGQEDAARAYIHKRLTALGLAPQIDAVGNLIARVAGVPAECDGEPPLLLNAHIDRVPPGLAHTPRIENGVMRSDGSTNLGADDAAGVAVILATVQALAERGLPHPPLLLLFTVGEEVGLTGAKAFDPAPWGAKEGIIFDNAGEAGVVVTRAATYIAFDVTIRGHGGHPGKRLEGAVSAIEIFRRAQYPWGSLDDDTTRISIGRVEGGSARNAVPQELRARGEIRTLAGPAEREALMARVSQSFAEAAQALGGSAEVSFDPHCDSYEVSEDEPLLRAWRAAIEARGGAFRTMTTFIGSDASALRSHTGVFTVSTGVMDEHTVEEWVPLAPLAELVETTAALLSRSH